MKGENMTEVHIDSIIGIVFGVLAIFSILSTCGAAPIVVKKQATKTAIKSLNDKIETHKFIAENTGDGKLQAACNAKIKDLEQQRNMLMFAKKFPSMIQY